MRSEVATRSMVRGRTLAGLFGCIETPGLFVGRTVILGKISADMLHRIGDEVRDLPVAAFSPP